MLTKKGVFINPNSRLDWNHKGDSLWFSYRLQTSTGGVLLVCPGQVSWQTRISSLWPWKLREFQWELHRDSNKGNTRNNKNAKKGNIGNNRDSNKGKMGAARDSNNGNFGKDSVCWHREVPCRANGTKGWFVLQAPVGAIESVGEKQKGKSLRNPWEF